MTKKIYLKDAVSPNLLLVDGLSRTGKMLTAKLVSNFQRIEYFQNDPLIETIGILRLLGLLDDDNAHAFLRLNLDIDIYNYAIGRNLNLRESDSSSVRLAANFADYEERMRGPDGQGVMDKLNRENRIPLFLTHAILTNIELFFIAVKSLKVVELTRHPVDLACSWYQRGWGERFGIDPLAFTITVEYKGRPVPWFAADWEEKYVSAPPMDRIILSILRLDEMCEKAFNKLSPEQQGHIHFIPYEHLMTKSQSEIDRLSGFLGAEPFPGMDGILAREGIPVHQMNVRVGEKLTTVQEKGSPQLVEQLLAAGRKYEGRWNLEPLEL